MTWNDRNEDTFLTLAEAGHRIRSGRLTSVALIEKVLERIGSLNPVLNCFGTVTSERALEQAQALDQLLAAGIDLGPLHGLPVAIKDCIDTAGIRTTGGSVIEKDRIPEQSATVVQRLDSCGAVLVGKTNLYEFAAGGPSTLWGEVHNPWSLDKTAGASSNGSAAAVAGGLATVALGTDMGGSIRIPAAMCGVFGLKPTIGRISRKGINPAASTLDHVGPITRTARDAALVMMALAGPDPKDRHTWDQPHNIDFMLDIEAPLKGLVIGVPVVQPGEFLEDVVRDALQQTYTVLEALGCSLRQVDLPSLAAGHTIMWTLFPTEVAEFYRDYLRNQGDVLQKNVKAILNMGELVPAVEYIHCQRVRQLLTDEMSDVFQSVDVVVMPMLPSPPWASEEMAIRHSDLEENRMTFMTRFPALFNVTGHPAASILTGFSEGLPLSAQIIAPHYEESRILRVANALERESPHHRTRPPYIDTKNVP